MLYAQTPRRRAGQAIGDLAAVAAVVLLVRLGMAVHDVVARLAEPGVALERAGRDLSGAADRAAGRSGGALDDLPLVGDALGDALDEVLSGPFAAVAGTGRALADAGVAQRDAVLAVALTLGVLSAALPIAVLVSRYVPWRWRGAAAATAARRLRADGADPSLFALRALVNRPLHELCRVSADPWGDFAAGDVTGLADLELRALGLRGTAAPPAPRGDP